MPCLPAGLCKAFEQEPTATKLFLVEALGEHLLQVVAHHALVRTTGCQGQVSSLGEPTLTASRANAVACASLGFTSRGALLAHWPMQGT